MKRQLFNLATLASLLLCVAAAVLWARSYTVAYYLKRASVDRHTAIVRIDTCILASGRLRVGVDRFRNEDYAEGVLPTEWRLSRDPYYYAWRLDPPGPWFARWQATDHRGKSAWSPASMWSLTVNLPVIVALAAVAPVIWRVKFLRRRHRRGRGLCESCGYNLTGNVSGVCPECGGFT